MKRLRVLVVCLIVALLFWYPNNHANCSEHSLSDPGQLAGDKDDNNNNPNDRKQEQDSMQLQEVEEWTIPTSYDVGLEAEKAAHHVHQEETIIPQVVEEEDGTIADPKFDPAPADSEPELSSEPVIESELQTDAQVQNQHSEQESVVLDPSPEQGHVTIDTPELLVDETVANQLPPSSDPLVPEDEVDDTLTSQSDGPSSTNAMRVASAGDKPPADSFVFAECSDSQCGVNPPKLATCENSFFGSPLLREGDKEGQQLDQILDSSLEGVDSSVSGHLQLLQEEEEEQQQQQEGHGEVQQDNNASLHQQQVGESVPGRESDPSVPGKDDIPTFDEWKKQVMEVEKEKSQNLHTSTSSIVQPVKKVQKNFKNNYASVECGAKILSANNEAKSTSAILMENMDLYMLNPCSNKIWFVIELCEPIQVKQLDIANFELFSSTPKDFLVSLSDRYPTNKWVKLGTFHARDERIIQSFPLDEQLYAKYVKVELLSHFGSEHFCPLSLFRVFGTSMVEEYEEISDSQYPSERLEYLDEDFDYPPGFQPSDDKASKNLLGSATNAILNMVNNIAANVLGGKPELEGQAGIPVTGNVTEELLTNKESVHATNATPVETPQDSTLETPVKLEDDTDPQNAAVSSTSTPSLEPNMDRQIVTLVEEEDEDEEPRQSTVTLLEEEEEEKSDEMVARETSMYCPFLASVSCLATLPELLHRWCAVVLAEERLRKLHTQTSPVVKTPISKPPQIPNPTPTPTQDVLPLTEKTPEPEAPLPDQNEGGQQSDLPLTPHTPPLDLQLEPSRTSTLFPHSFSDIHSSLTPTHQDLLLPPIKDAALNPVSTPPLQAAPLPDTQQLSATPPASVPSPSPQLPTQKMDAPDTALPTPKEQDLPTASRPEDLIIPPTEQLTTPPVMDPNAVGDLQKPNINLEEHVDPQGGEPHRVDTAEDELLNGTAHRAATDFYAELQNGVDYNNGVPTSGSSATSNGAAVHGSSQKESVFMRLNNRIKALEMNMSLSGRYLEELSQRYRKQMEEMQRAFNKTIIKLQNTSRIAEKQDQKQQDSIQALQTQLGNLTKLMLNLTDTVTQLQKEVSDRQCYLVFSLVLCLSLGLLVCVQCCRSSCTAARADVTAGALVVPPKSNNYPSPKRCFSSYDDMSLKRRVTCPLVRSKSFHLSSSTEVGPDDLYIVEPLRFSPEKKKKRCKSKSLDKVETLKPSGPLVPLTNGDIKCNGFHASPHLSLPVFGLPPALPPLPPPPTTTSSAPVETTSLPRYSSKEPVSETPSSSSSTHSEDSFTVRLPPPSPAFSYAELPPTTSLQSARPPSKSRQERRSTKRRKSRHAELADNRAASLSGLQHLMKSSKELSIGTIQVTAFSGQV
ncbi:SUN domain-containing ossification factor isoform X2 [Corythoichthys intestinalis]|uniref:SUN domain-containing ossification factor isoform X2 n=1 Tax=Corythoichthys intestinalis TaxID=161448 RepID=UPI0025A4D9E7|nr:SUN domain-containing ossification factor isoform X2 [Corythoichthys intestinalis]